MSRPDIRFHRSATDEGVAAVVWYEERQPGLGAEFLAEVDRAVERIVESPFAWPECRFDRRARVVRLLRFPYALIYLTDPAREGITVVAVAHAKRRPGYWQRRLSPIP